MKKIRLKVVLTAKDGKTATVFARPTQLIGGMWAISERTRQRVNRLFGIAHDDSNPGIKTTATICARDAEGWHTFTYWKSNEESK